MDNINQRKNDCCSGDSSCTSSDRPNELQPIWVDSTQTEVCCGSPPGPPSSALEKPGYRLEGFVEDLKNTTAGQVPRVKSKLERSDFWGTLIARLGIKRDQYKIAPGLYCIGNPNEDSAVLVTANYKLSFDTLRRELNSVDAWILALDTRGINVWCAAGKMLFSTSELTQRIKQTQLNKVVRHNRIILPQLGATGVSAPQVRKESGFKVIWGPVRAKDVPRFLADGNKADDSMRQVTFSTLERTVLVPVELSHLPMVTLWVLPAVFMISGIGTGFFSLNDAWNRGLIALSAYVGAILSGAVVTPILLPWIPGRTFALKGALVGIVTGLTVMLVFRSSLIWLEALALLLITMGMSSFLAMNFTGSTPFTSPSGVEKEMRRAIPLQAAAALIALVAWVGAAFAG